MALPLVHPFGTEGRRYIYDCNTNEIVAVGELQFHLIPAFEGDSGRPLPASIKQRYGPEALAKAVGRIREARKAGLFSANRPRRRPLAFTNQDVARALSHEMGSVVLGITEKCNLKCSYCVYSGGFPKRRQHSRRTMSFETARRAIDYLVAHSAKHDGPPALSFFGGEPLLEFELIKKCVSHFQQATGGKCVVTISTNGTPLRADIIRFLEENGVYLFISLDGPREINDAYRTYPSGAGSFGRVMGRIRLLREMAPSYWDRYVSLLVTLVPPVDLAVLDEFFRELAIRIRPTFVDTYGSDLNVLRKAPVLGLDSLAGQYRDACWAGVFDKPGENYRRHSFCQNIFMRALRAIHLRQKTALGAEIPISGACIPGAHKLYVSVDGELSICEKAEGCERAVIGDVRNGIRMDLIRRTLEEFGSLDWSCCRDCWLVRLCPLCYVHVLHGQSWNLRKRDQSCEQFRKYYSFCLNLYCEILEKNKRALDYLEFEDPRPSP